MRYRFFLYAGLLPYLLGAAWAYARGGAFDALAFWSGLAGVIFAIEEMSRSFDERANGLVIGTIIAGGIVSVALLGNYTYFGVTSANLGGSALAWATVPVCGIAGGLLGVCSAVSGW